jgi:hypothetical protein
MYKIIIKFIHPVELLPFILWLLVLALLADAAIAAALIDTISILQIIPFPTKPVKHWQLFNC